MAHAQPVADDTRPSPYRVIVFAAAALVMALVLASFLLEAARPLRYDLRQNLPCASDAECERRADRARDDDFDNGRTAPSGGFIPDTEQSPIPRKEGR